MNHNEIFVRNDIVDALRQTDAQMLRDFGMDPDTTNPVEVMRTSPRWSLLP